VLLHRDLKLDNCLCFESDVEGECDVKLGDFGCFKHMRCGQADDESYR
jgi:serine/threonine protein kinase